MNTDPRESPALLNSLGTAVTRRALNRYNAWAAIRRRAKAAGFLTPRRMSHLEGNWHHDLSGERQTARARPAPGAFWKPPFPAPKLFWAIVGTQVFAVLMCAFGWGVPALRWILIGLVWEYNLVWMIVQDVVKLGIYWELNARAADQTPFLKHLKAVVPPHGALHQH